MMKSKKYQLALLLLMCFGLSGLYAQQSTVSAGNNVTNENGSVSYSVGQIFYTVSEGNSGAVASGLQQPFEISVINSLVQFEAINLIVSTYPNPTSDFLIIRSESLTEFTTQSFAYQLYDISGKLIDQNSIKEDETKIEMHDLMSSTYVLKITNNKQSIKSFRIIKN